MGILEGRLSEAVEESSVKLQYLIMATVGAVAFGWPTHALSATLFGATLQAELTLTSVEGGDPSTDVGVLALVEDSASSGGASITTTTASQPMLGDFSSLSDAPLTMSLSASGSTNTPGEGFGASFGDSAVLLFNESLTEEAVFTFSFSYSVDLSAESDTENGFAFAAGFLSLETSNSPDLLVDILGEAATEGASPFTATDVIAFSVVVALGSFESIALLADVFGDLQRADGPITGGEVPLPPAFALFGLGLVAAPLRAKLRSARTRR